MLSAWAHPALYAPQSFAWTAQDASTGVLGFTLQAGCETLLCALNTGTQAVQGFGLKPGWGSYALPLFAAGWVDHAPRPIANGWLALDLAPLSWRNLADRVVFRLDKPAFPAILGTGHKNRGAGGHLRLRSKQLCFEHPIPDPGNAGVGSFGAEMRQLGNFGAPAVCGRAWFYVTT